MPITVLWFEARATTNWSVEMGRPGSTTHAKTYGTTLTACGLNASNFEKNWGVAFDGTSDWACRDCSTLTASTRVSNVACSR